MPDEIPADRLESLAVFATVVRSPVIARVEAAFLLFGAMELATWIAMLVYAYERGGPTASGLIAFAQLAPATAFAPSAAALGERIPRTRMLAIAYLVPGLLTLLTAACLGAGLASPVVYAAVVLSGTTITLVRPAHAAVLPTIALTPSELTAANVASGTVETVGALVGTIGGGILLAVAGAGAVFLAGGLAMLAATAAVAGMRQATPETMPRRTVAADAGGPEEQADLPVPSRDGGGAGRRMRNDLATGLRTIRDNAHVRALMAVLALGTALVGMLDVLGVVLALDVLEVGDAGVGVIAGALSAGGLIGSAGAIALVGRLRIGRPLVIAALVFGLGVAAAGALPVVGVAVACLVAAGVGRVVLDVAGRTLLQRVAPAEFLARIFGVLEGLNMGALSIGTIVAPLLVLALGPAGAFAVAGLSVPVGVLVLRRALASADRAGVIHEVELGLLREIPMFAPLRAPVVERLAALMAPVMIARGEAIIREGDPGDRFYVIAAGRCAVTVHDRPIRTMDAGDAFGEIALLRDVPRTATVTAIDDVVLFALERDAFLEAVTGQAQSRLAAERLVAERLATTS